MGQGASNSGWDPAARAQLYKMACLLGRPCAYDASSGGYAVWDLTALRARGSPVARGPLRSWLQVIVRDRQGQPVPFPWPHYANVVVAQPLELNAETIACLARLSEEYGYLPNYLRDGDRSVGCLIVSSGSLAMCAILCKIAVQLQQGTLTCKDALEQQVLPKAFLQGLRPERFDPGSPAPAVPANSAVQAEDQDRTDAFYQWLAVAEAQRLARGDLSTPATALRADPQHSANPLYRGQLVGGPSGLLPERFQSSSNVSNPVIDNDPAVLARSEYEDQQFYRDQDVAAAAREPFASSTVNGVLGSSGTVDPRFTVDTAAIYYDVGSDVNDITRTYGTVSQRQRYPTYQDALAGYHSLPPLPPRSAAVSSRADGFHPPPERFAGGDPFLQAIGSTPMGVDRSTDLFLQKIMPSS